MSGWDGDDGIGGWHPLSHQNVRANEPCGVFFSSNTVSHHNHQEVKCKTDLVSLTLGLLHLYLYFNVKHLFNNTSCWPDQVTSHLWSCCALYVSASSDAGGVHWHSWYNLEDLGRRGERVLLPILWRWKEPQLYTWACLLHNTIHQSDWYMSV